MKLEDKLFPGILAGGTDNPATLSQAFKAQEGAMVIGHHDGQFQLISMVFEESTQTVVQENMVEAETWKEFLVLVRDMFGMVFAMDPDEMSLDQLELRAHRDASAVQELITRARLAAEEMNDIFKILSKNQIATHIKATDFLALGEKVQHGRIDLKFTKEM